GLWQHDMTGNLASDNALFSVPPGFDLASKRSAYERFSIRLGSAWWAPMIRARHAKLSGEGSGVVDNSTPPLVTDITTTQTKLDFDQTEGLVYFTFGSTLRVEAGGGLQKFKGRIETTQVRNQTLSGQTVTSGQRDLPETVHVLYGAMYAEPVSWLSFG